MEAIKELLTYDYKTGFFRALVTRANLVAGEVAGYLHKPSGYWMIMLYYKKYKAHRLAWLYHFGRWPDGELDHINGDRSDNRIENLRECSHTQNAMNAKTRDDNTSGARGVYWCIKTQKWRSYIQVDTKRVWLGRHVRFEDAVAARVAAEEKYYGDFARGKMG